MKPVALHFVITAGGTREYIDPVRFISNASSGRMGYCLARAAVCAGHRVTLVSAPTSLKVPKGVDLIEVETSDDMFTAVRAAFGGCDCLIMTAAVSDYKPASTKKNKIKKADQSLILALKPTHDILAWAGRHKKKGQVLVGFALEDKHLKKNADEKRRAKNLDMIVANSPDAIGAETSTVYIKTADSNWQTIEDSSKSRTAGKIIKRIEKLFV